jgi:hypothetical protein
MSFIDALRQMGPAALVSMFMGIVPLGFGILYAVRPTEHRLALMRPLSLAAIFAAIHGTALGVVNAFVYVANRPTQTLTTPAVLVGLAESGMTLVFDFGCLMLAWLCVSVGLWRRP